MTLRSRGVFVLALALLSSCSAPLRIVEDPIDPRTVGERAPGTRLETDEDSSLPTLPPTLQSARRRLLGIAALIANNGLQERRSPDLLWLATQALRDDSGSQRTPVHEQLIIHELDFALMARWKATRLTSEDDLVAIGARGMLTSLPSGTAYFRRADARRHALQVPEETFGLTVGVAVPYPVILTVEEGSSAALAFVRPGDQLTEISGQPTSGKSRGELYAELALQPQEDVTLGLQLAPEETRRVVLRRSSLTLRHALRCRLLDRKVLYLRPGQIGPGTAGQAREAALSAGEMAGQVILDLRESTGGYFESGVGLLDVFVERGTLGEIRMRDKLVRWNARPGDPLERSAVVVLVGPGTDETAVMVAAALQDLARAKTLGEPTAEGREVRAWFWLKGGDALQLTVGEARRAGPKPLERVLPDVTASKTPKAEPVVEDIPCPGANGAEAVAVDPLVAQALQLLSTTH
ncbi:MAG TPA: S41 family peptidase [Anaeromyxobacteraceae bacterium]|nr:S41 family peptidase [Anaeromyxobacteraceae bacterium]